MKRILVLHCKLLAATLILCTMAYGQDLPRIIQPSPEVSQLFKFQDYPMDYSTGLPQISIPIYEIKTGSLSVPVSLSYHASGRRVYDQDGPIAVNWSLNAGGMVSRTVYGAVDFGNSAGTFKFPYPFNTTSLSNANNLTYFENLMHFNLDNPPVTTATWADGEYDIFSYSFPGQDGRFFFKDVNNVKTPKLLPYKPFIVTPVYTSGGLTEIDILDDKGIFYKFLGMETTLQQQSAIETVPAITGYALTQMISADKVDTVNFTYAIFTQTRRTLSQQIVFNDYQTNYPVGYLTDYILPEGYPNTSADVTGESPYQISRLTEIDYRQGKVLFNLVSGSDKVDNIQVFDKNSNLIKTIQLNRSQLNSLSELEYSTNKLDGVVFKDNTGAAVENYSLQYYPLVSNPDVSTTGPAGLNVRYRDYWGYYNASGVTNMIPYYPSLSYYHLNAISPDVQNFGNFGAVRTPNLAALESGVLQKITYPTGGSTEFVYENNKYYSIPASQAKLGPGLRVAQIKTNDNNGTTSYKTFTYGGSESGYGVIDMEPDITNMATETMEWHYFTDIAYPQLYRTRVFSSDFISSVSEIGERPVIYDTVTEYDGTATNNPLNGSVPDNIGKTVYTYDYNPWGAAQMPVFSNPISGPSIQKMHIAVYNYWNNPSLLTKTDYRNISPAGTNPSYVIRKQTTNTYIATTSETDTAIHVQRVYDFPPPDNTIPVAHTTYNQEPWAVQQQAHPQINIYTYNLYTIPVGYKNLHTANETVYNDDGTSISNLTTYTYNSKQYASQVARTGSDMIAQTSTIKYPFDYTGNSVLTQMISASVNMLNFPVEQNDFKNSIALKGLRTNYHNFGTTVPLIYPQSIDASVGTNAYETRIQYYSYDAYGNPTSVSKQNDTKISYLWGYNNSYPVAEVKNANANEIFFDGFEEGFGWDGTVATPYGDTPLTAYDNTKSYTGAYSGRIDKSTSGVVKYTHSDRLLNISLTAPTTYHYSGWVYSNGPNANLFLFMYRAGETGYFSYVDHITTTTTNSWVFLQKDFTVPADVVKIGMRIDNDVAAGSVWFDDIRLHPGAGWMTTYTYRPLVGMTSQTNINNQPSFYEYDGYNRLKLVRDLNRNIIKTYKYQYQSATP